MRNFRSVIGTLVVIMVQSVALSALFSAIQWLLSIASICERPTWVKFAYGSLGLFLVLFVLYAFKTGITLYRYHKDPVFKDANLMTGISWNDYKRLKSDGHRTE